MANALQDQLLKAGLVDDRQLRKAQKEKKKESRQNAGGKGSVGEAQQRRLQLEKEKADRDRELNRIRKEAAEQKAVTAQIKQLVDAHRVAHDQGELPYKFADDGKVKTIHVSDPLRLKIVRGELAIVKSEGRYELVPADVARKIQTRCASHLILWNQSRPTNSGDVDDEYSRYTVPDDLMW